MSEDICGGTIIFLNRCPKNQTSQATKPDRKSKKETLFPIFDQLKEFTDDPYWIDFLDRMHRGVLPKNYRYTESMYLTYKCRTKTQTLEISEPGTQECFDDLRDFLYYNSKIESPTDTYIRSISEDPMEEKELSFKKIRTTGRLLKVALANYIHRFARRYKFNSEDVARFEAFLRTRIAADLIRPEDVVLENNLVQDITTIRFNETTRKILIDLPPYRGVHREFSESDETPTMVTPSLRKDIILLKDSKKKKLSILEEWQLFLELLSRDKGKPRKSED
jgi:hypothetical protein